MSGSRVNGEPQQASATLGHLIAYPIVHDGIKTVQSHPMGQKSIRVGDSVYKKLAQPLLPYLSGPCQSLYPLFKRADAFGDRALDKVDEKLPFFQKQTGELYHNVQSCAMFPLHISIAGRDHVIQTYQHEHEKVGGAGLVTSGTAVVNTTGILITEICGSLASFLSNMRGAAREQSNKVNGANRNGNSKPTH